MGRRENQKRRLELRLKLLEGQRKQGLAMAADGAAFAAGLLAELDTLTALGDDGNAAALSAIAAPCPVHGSPMRYGGTLRGGLTLWLCPQCEAAAGIVEGSTELAERSHVWLDPKVRK